tara:strand:+ start:412 stop:666 length:255 start_codon:yes stop_codon:yes gene_type:complete
MVSYTGICRLHIKTNKVKEGEFMINDVLQSERDLLAMLITLKGLIIDNDIFVMKGMIEPLDKYIEKSQYVINELQLSLDSKYEE